MPSIRTDWIALSLSIPPRAATCLAINSSAVIARAGPAPTAGPAPAFAAQAAPPGPYARRPVHGATRQQVQVQMEHGLAAVAIAVHHHAVAALGETLAPGERRRGQHELADQRGMVRIQVIQR